MLKSQSDEGVERRDGIAQVGFGYVRRVFVEGIWVRGDVDIHTDLERESGADVKNIIYLRRQEKTERLLRMNALSPTELAVLARFAVAELPYHPGAQAEPETDLVHPVDVEVPGKSHGDPHAGDHPPVAVIEHPSTAKEEPREVEIEALRSQHGEGDHPVRAVITPT